MESRGDSVQLWPLWEEGRYNWPPVRSPSSLPLSRQLNMGAQSPPWPPVLAPPPTWALSPRGSRCTFHPAGRLRLHPTWLGVKLCSTDGDVENIRDIFQTGLLSYHESLRRRRARMSEMGAWDLFPPPSSSLGSVVRQERGLQPLSAISAQFWGQVVGVWWGGRLGGVRLQWAWGGG